MYVSKKKLCGRTAELLFFVENIQILLKKMDRINKDRKKR